MAFEDTPDVQQLVERVASALRAAGATVATAESCTGGLIAKLLTDVPGSSAYFLEGMVTYHDRAKTRSLDVDETLLARHGAVSAAVAEAMAHGCRRQAGSDFAVAVTGIAGPGGGTAFKPVGLVYVALAAPSGVEVHELRLAPSLGRSGIREHTACFALQKIGEAVEESTRNG